MRRYSPSYAWLCVLPLADVSVDGIGSMFVLCSVAEPERASAAANKVAIGNGRNAPGLINFVLGIT